MLHMGIAVAAAAVMSMGAGPLPDGTLFLETHPPAKKWETYKITESKALPLRLNPCERRTASTADRRATRAVHYQSEDTVKYEQLVVYKSVSAAREAMRGLRADLSRCANYGKGPDRHHYYTKPLKVGDDALRAGSRFFENGEQTVVVRNGATVYVVGESGWPTKSLPLKRFKGLIDQAERMTAKVCDLPKTAC
ncbi:hypothetical protein [Nonomuraea guangzhouensis]|uniref:Sensor domain-containing protein n=1 Tax=Nonomuraea guangzhouensis TaxID=1291555 RepID=A0ABW4FZU4_9ACTN|nr:hypothetical protein [Nonomuraea guangzhouensis]